MLSEIAILLIWVVEDIHLRGQFGPKLIEEKLDRFLCNQEWRIEFFDDLATNLVHWESDHYQVMMEIRERQRSLGYEKKNLH